MNLGTESLLRLFDLMLKTVFRVFVRRTKPPNSIHRTASIFFVSPMVIRIESTLLPGSGQSYTPITAVKE